MESQEGANHCHHCKIAEAHTVALTNQVIRRPSQVEECGTEKGGGNGIDEREPSRTRRDWPLESSQDEQQARCVAGSQCCKEQSQQYSGIGEFRRQVSGFRVHEDEADNEKAEEAGLQGRPSQAEICVAGDEREGDQQFDQRIAEGNRALAVPTLSLEQEPAKDRDVIAPCDWRVAMRAA